MKESGPHIKNVMALACEEKTYPKGVIVCPNYENQLILVMTKQSGFYAYFDTVLNKWVRWLKPKSSENFRKCNINKKVKSYIKILNTKPTLLRVKRIHKSFIASPEWTDMFRMWNSDWGRMSPTGVPGFLDAPLESKYD